jgi:hypothetical protein
LASGRPIGALYLLSGPARSRMQIWNIDFPALGLLNHAHIPSTEVRESTLFIIMVTWRKSDLSEIKMDGPLFSKIYLT